MARLTIRVTVTHDGLGQTELSKSLQAAAQTVDGIRNGRGEIVAATSATAGALVDLALQDYEPVPAPVPMAVLPGGDREPERYEGDDIDGDGEQT